jgi:molecular chaperone GrpE
LQYKNIQERMASQNKQGDVMAIREIVREMLEVMDNFDRAFMAVAAETDEQKEIEVAYKEVYQSMLDTFEELGVTPVPTVGIEFDYELHQAVMQKPSDEYEEGIVSEELQKGFILGETLIRAAMVAVAA